MILVTGAAGFIGSQVAKALLKPGEKFTFRKLDSADHDRMVELAKEFSGSAGIVSDGSTYGV